jgi:hypothetical protein
VIVWTAALFAVYLIILWRLPEPQIISMLEAVSERVVVTVLDQRQASFIVGRTKLSGEKVANGGACVAGLVRPVRGATVAYTRLGKAEGIRIEIFPPGQNDDAVVAEFIAANSNDSGEPLRGVVAFEPAQGDCEQVGDAIARLPIHGRLRVGEEQLPPARARALPASLLHTGTLSVAANAMTFGIVKPTVYPVTTVTLPVGSRIEVSPEHNQDPRSFWWGFVQVPHDAPALSVRAATEAPSLEVYRPASNGSSHIEVGLLVQLLNDPNLARLQLIAAVLVFLFYLIVTLNEVISAPARGEPQTVIFDIEAARRAARAGGSLDAADHSADDHSPPRG